MTTPIHPQLSHCGIYAQDVGKLVDFYTRALGLVLSDRGSTQAGELAFLTASPHHHHQLVIVSGRAPQGVTTVNQLSFKVAGLDQLKAMHRRVRDAGIGETRQVSHGNALSFYFGDPEGNRVEIYMDTPWYIPQPYAVPIDLTQSDEAIMAAAEKDARKSPGFMPLPDWEAEVARRLGRA